MSAALSTFEPSRSFHAQGCASCAHVSACQAGGFGKDSLSAMRRIVERAGLLRDGEYLYRPRSPLRALFAVQSGMAKTVSVDSAGRELVLAFHLPGELFGLDAICLGYHDNAVIALGRTQFCRFPFEALRCLSTHEPEVQWHLINTMSRQLHQQSLSSGDYPAEERMAAFLVDMANRRGSLGLGMEQVPLPMSRADIGNHLRLATETVSRLLARFRDAGLVRIERHAVHLDNLTGLRELAKHLLEH